VRRSRVAKKSAFDADDGEISQAQAFAQVIKIPILMPDSSSSRLFDPDGRLSECQPEARIAQHPSDFYLGQMLAEFGQRHSDTGRNARGRMFLRVPNNHSSIPWAAATASARRRNSSTEGAPMILPVAACR